MNNPNNGINQNTHSQFAYDPQAHPSNFPYNPMIHHQPVQHFYPNYYPAAPPPIKFVPQHGYIASSNPVLFVPQHSTFYTNVEPYHVPSYHHSSSSVTFPSSNYWSSSALHHFHHHVSVPRGPPKKPKKSGFALWVGNLPPNTTLAELCSMFGTNDIQSIFLIQSTSCAFVNYKSEKAVLEGRRAFESRGSKLRGNRLIVKIKTDQVARKDKDKSKQPSTSSKAPANSRYFVCKSLTVEDLQATTRYGMWATQSHNQKTFNKAFEVSTNAKRNSRCFGLNKQMNRLYISN